MLRRVALVVVLASLAALPTASTEGGAATLSGDPVVAAAGDICGSSCPSTAKLIGSQPKVDRVLTLGDNVYPCGSLSQFDNKYDPAWGQFLSKTMATIGNHEYETSASSCNAKATGYFTYFGPAHSQPNGDKGYYYFDLTGSGTSAAKWRIIVLNGNCSIVSCAAGSSQEHFLASAISGAPSGSCIMAAWHQARFSGSSLTGQPSYLPFWNDLYAAHAALILNAHAHYYERYLPQKPSGAADPANGITEIIAGTGGTNHGSASVINRDTTAFYNNKDFGVVFLTLHAGSFDWKFISTGGTVIDKSSSSVPCTRRP